MTARGLAAVACLVGLSACSDDLKTLEGSLGELMDLRYARTDVNASAAAVAVKFVTPQGDGENTVLEVSARLGNIALEPNVPVDLADAPGGVQRGVVTRNVYDDPRRSFPALERGQLMLRAAPVSGAKVTGQFSVTFINGIQFANGRTVYGTFEAQIP